MCDKVGQGVGRGLPARHWYEEGLLGSFCDWIRLRVSVCLPMTKVEPQLKAFAGVLVDAVSIVWRHGFDRSASFKS